MKKIVSFLIGLMLVFTACTAMADTAEVLAAPGRTLTMNVDLSAGGGYVAKIAIETNDAPVTFVSAQGGSVNDTVPPREFGDYFVVFNADGATLSADGTAFSGSGYAVKALEAGNIGTLSFKVDDDAALGTYTVSAKVVSGSCTVDAKLTFTIVDRFPGDADEDGEVTTNDAFLILRWISGYDVTINEANADCDGDGEVTTNDAFLILRWISGYDVTLV